MVLATDDSPIPYVMHVEKFLGYRDFELTNPIERGVFEAWSDVEVTKDAVILNSRFVDEMKFAGSPEEYAKSSLAVQTYEDRGKDFIL